MNVRPRNTKISIITLFNSILFFSSINMHTYSFSYSRVVELNFMTVPASYFFFPSPLVFFKLRTRVPVLQANESSRDCVYNRSNLYKRGAHPDDRFRGIACRRRLKNAQRKRGEDAVHAEKHSDGSFFFHGGERFTKLTIVTAIIVTTTIVIITIIDRLWSCECSFLLFFLSPPFKPVGNARARSRVAHE
jgi:hypothetical protein